MTTRDLDAERSTEDVIGALPVNRLEAVVPRVSAPILGGAAPAVSTVSATPPEGIADVAQDLPQASHLRSAHLEPAGALAATAAVAMIDIRLGLMFAAFVCASAGMRSVDRHIPFSFGEGFVGYRADPRWPRGVQEDDDVHWNWKRRGVPEAVPARDRFP